MRRLAAASIAIASLIASLLAADPTIEDCFRTKIANARAAAGVHQLKPNTILTSLARAHSDEMASQDTIYHNDDLPQQAPSFTYLGENVGMGPSCDLLHEAFMSSPGHRANIEDSDYTRLGVGVTVEPNENSTSGVTIYVTQVFGSTPVDKQPAVKPPAKQQTPNPACTCPG